MELGFQAKSVCYRVCAPSLSHHVPLFSTRKAKLQGLYILTGATTSWSQSLRSLSYINWQNWNLRPNLRFHEAMWLLSKVSVTGYLHPPSRERSPHFHGLDHIFLETKEIDKISAAFWSFSKLLPAYCKHGLPLTARAERTSTEKKGRLLSRWQGGVCGVPWWILKQAWAYTSGFSNERRPTSSHKLLGRNKYQAFLHCQEQKTDQGLRVLVLEGC